MARTGGDEARYDQEKEEEEEEALLLEEKPDCSIQTEDEFDFCSCAGVASGLLPQMCAADELFYRGQILSRSASRSESTDDHGGSSLGSSSSTTKIKQRAVKNVFHSHPSPKPQIRASTSRQGSFNGGTQKTSTWAFLRPGLVRTPELELQHLKNRMSSHNRGSAASNNGGKGNKRTGLLGDVSCKFSVETVPPATAAKQMMRKKQAPSHHRTFEWLKDLSHASFPDDS